jgi:hypothetical protein
MKFGVRIPSLSKRIAARTSPARGREELQPRSARSLPGTTARALDRRRWRNRCIGGTGCRRPAAGSDDWRPG